jgi:hypothetical protein
MVETKRFVSSGKYNKKVDSVIGSAACRDMFYELTHSGEREILRVYCNSSILVCICILENITGMPSNCISMSVQR